MAAGKSGRQRTAAEERERARVYQARLGFHADQARRRLRDNWVAAIVGGVVIVGAVLGQVVFYTSGPGAPEPVPSPSVTPSPSVSSSTDPVPGPTTTP